MYMFIRMGSCTSLLGGACFLFETKKLGYGPEGTPTFTLHSNAACVLCSGDILFSSPKNATHICFPCLAMPDAYHANQTWSINYNLEAHSSNSATHRGPPGSLFGCVLTFCFYI